MRSRYENENNNIHFLLAGADVRSTARGMESLCICNNNGISINQYCGRDSDGRYYE